MATRYGDMLRAERERAKKTMGDLARALGVSVTFVSDVERGRRAPPVERTLQLAAFLGIDPSALLQAAASDRSGEFEIKMKAMNATPKMVQVGAGLMRRWADLSDEQLEQIEKILERGGREEPEV